MTCTFFGHRDCDHTIYKTLEKTIIELIQVKGVTKFLVGNNGNFDRLVLTALLKCSKKIPNIEYCVVLAYMPKNSVFYYPTIFPEELVNIPKRYAIPYRNKYMIENSDFVITYVSRHFGGAYSSFKKAQKMNKTVINLYKAYE